MSPNRPCVCACCRVVHVFEALTVWESSEDGPGLLDGRLVCEDCESELIADEHRNTREHCGCRHCAAAFAKHMRVSRDHEARTHGGLRPEALALIGLTDLLDDLNLTVAPE